MLNDIEEMAIKLFLQQKEEFNQLCKQDVGTQWEDLTDPCKTFYRQRVITNDLIFRLRKRAEIRRQIQRGNGETDRIADLLEEAANALEGK